MDTERWGRARQLFAAALAVPAADRPAFLAARADDPDLLAEVADLLAHHREDDGFLEPPVREAPAELPPGARVGPYEIVRPVGRGGMGVVYEALRVDDYRQVVALKVIRRADGGEEQVRRFYAERQILARLQHPNVSRLLDGGVTADGSPYLVMEFIPGAPLDEYCERHALPLADRVRLLRAVCAAVDHAHRAAVVHRDLKPANVLVTPDGVPRVTDFGLAKQVGVGPPVADGTVSGAILGTPEYMAPEQAAGRGREVGPAADVYALGAVLYRLLAGRAPFRADSPIDTILQVLNSEPVPPRRLRPEVPRDLETICLKCLEKQPRRRYDSAAEVAEDLRRHLDREPIRARPVSPAGRLIRWARREPGWAATALLALLGVVTVVWMTAAFVLRLQRAGEQTRRAYGESRRRAAQLTLDRAVSFCEQGYIGRGTLLMAAGLRTADPADADLQRLFRLNLAAWGSRLNPIRGFADAGDDAPALAYGAEGRLLITGGADGRARVWDAVRGGPVGPPLDGAAELSAVALSPDGRTAATGARDGTLALWDVASGGLLRREQLDAKPLRVVAFSPDGQTLLAGGGEIFGSTGAAWLRDVRTGAPRGPALVHTSPVRAAAFSADGRFFVTSCEGPTVRVWDARDGRPLPERLEAGRPAWLLQVALSPDGRFVAACSLDKEAWLWDRGVTPPRLEVLPHPGNVRCLAFGGDGRSLVTGCDWGGGEGAIHRWRWCPGARGGAWRPDGPLIHHQGLIHALAFRHDGMSLAAASRSPFVRLWEVLPPPSPRTLVHDSAVNAVAFHPTEGLLATGCGRPEPRWGSARLWRLDTGEPVGAPINRAGSVTQLAFSPDGKVLLINDLDKQTSLWRVRDQTAVGPLLRHTQFVESVAWSRDGRRILMGKEDGEAFFWDPVEGRTVGPVLRHPDPVYAAALSPDGATAVTGDMAGRVRVWRSADGALLGTLPQQYAAVQAVAISADSLWLATAGRDKSAQVWDAATLQPAGRSLLHPEAVWTVAFSPDGSLVATGCGEVGGDRGEWRLWDAKSGVPLGPAQPSHGRVLHLAFSPDGGQIAIACEGGEACLFPVPVPLEGAAEDVFLWAQVATGMDVLLDGGGLPSDEIIRTLDPQAWEAKRRQLERGSPPRFRTR